MLWFNENKRQRMLGLVENIVKDEKLFEVMFKKFCYSRMQMSLSEVESSIVQSRRKKELSSLLLELKRMVSEDNELMHLILELRRKGVISFAGQGQKKSSQQILKIAIELGKKVDETKKIVDELNRSYEGEPHGLPNFRVTPKLREFRDMDMKLKQLETRVWILAESEKRDIHELDRLLRADMDISEGIVKSIEEGSLKIEIHKGLKLFRYHQPYASVYYGYGILIFDMDFLVAEIALKRFTGKMVVSSTEAHLRGKAYVERCIKILFEGELIEEWESDHILSNDAEKMYERLRKDSNFLVEQVYRGSIYVYIVRLRVQ